MDDGSVVNSTTGLPEAFSSFYSKLFFLCVEIDEQYQTFVEGQIFQVKTDDGQPTQFESTGYLIVKKEASPQKIVVPVTCVLRKVILYPHRREPDHEFVVVDFQRKTSPLTEYDDVVPFYPEEGDMVLINGTDPEPWLGRVITIYEDRQIAKLLYYIKSGEKDDGGFQIDIYTPERNPRLAYDKVSWNSIITLAEGEWNNNVWRGQYIRSCKVLVTFVSCRTCAFLFLHSSMSSPKRKGS